MNENETEKKIDNMIDLVIKVLMRNDFRGVLIAEMEKYDDKKSYELPPKARPTIMKQELENAFDKIFEIRKLAENLYNLDIKNEIFEITIELEEDWAKVYNNVDTESIAANIRFEELSTVAITASTGGMANVFNRM